MKFGNLKHDKGVAGTAVLLGLIVALFVIGLLVMIFALMGGALQNASFTSTSASVSNETGAWFNSTGYTVDNAGARGFSGFAVSAARNGTDGVAIGAGNYTVDAAGIVYNATATIWQSVQLDYSYTYNADNTATSVINDTTTSIASVTTFFSLFIVIGSMVVLILLTVIIIVAIRQSGMLGGTA